MAGIRALFGTGLSVAALLVAAATPASAHATTAPPHGSDTARVDAAHWVITVCDGEADNHGVYAEYVTWRAGSGVYTVGDPNGSASPCGSETPDDGYSILRYRVCEQTEGCAGWRSTD